MLTTKPCSPRIIPLSSSPPSTDHFNPIPPPSSSSSSSPSSSFSKCCRVLNPRKRNIKSIACIGNHSYGSSGHRHHHHHHHQPHDDYIQASLLLSDTIKHHHLRKQGFPEDTKQLPARFAPLSTQVRGLRSSVNSVELSILKRFRHPTMFLKISCEGDFLLPIVVGEFAVESLLDSVDEDDHMDCLNQFEFARKLVVELGYEVKMVKITKRVVSTYFARIYFGKVGRSETFSVDARPSDAVNVAKICKAPIYVNKDIVSADAIRIAYGNGRMFGRKPVYDVLLDSPVEGPDSLVEELKFMWNMKLAVEEERYGDAAKWRDELAKLR